MGSSVTRYPGRGAWHQLLLDGNGDRCHPSGVGGWLKHLGIFGQRSHEKRIPATAFTLNDRQVGLLLAHLWATDGCISLRDERSKGAPRVYFSTCSIGLAQDVMALLLRLGIVARLRTTWQAGAGPVHGVDVSGAEQQRTFLDAVGAFGPRAVPAARLRDYLDSIVANPNTDTLPRESFVEVKAAMSQRGVSHRAIASARGTSYGGSAHSRFAPSRQAVASCGPLLDDPHLSHRSAATRTSLKRNVDHLINLRRHHPIRPFVSALASRPLVLLGRNDLLRFTSKRRRLPMRRPLELFDTLQQQT